MTDITKHEKILIVNNLTQTELEIVSAASRIFSRVFNVALITPRLKTKFSDTGVYQAIKRLEDKGVFFVDKEDNKKLSIRFTEKGRSICGFVKQKMQTDQLQDLFQPALF